MKSVMSALGKWFSLEIAFTDGAKSLLLVMEARTTGKTLRLQMACTLMFKKKFIDVSRQPARVQECKLPHG